MPAQWTGELVGKMHNAGVTGKELAAQLGKEPKIHFPGAERPLRAQESRARVQRCALRHH